MIGKEISRAMKRGLQSLVFGRSLYRKEGAEFAKNSEVGEYLSPHNTGLLINGRDLRLSERVSFQNVAVYGVTGKGKSTALARPIILDKGRSDRALLHKSSFGGFTSGIHAVTRAA